MTFRLAPVLMVFLAGCAVVPPSRPPAPAASPVAAAAPPPAVKDWRDRAETPGSWRYTPGTSRSRAGFGAGGRDLLSISCDRASRRVLLWVGGGQGPVLTVRTSYGQRTLPAQAMAGGAQATLPANDPMLDQIGFSRGRISIATSGVPDLVVPAWAEPSRVFEDCRG